jgi:hypothetical protein
LSQGPPTPMAPPPRQQAILQPSQPMPHTQQRPSLASSTQQPLPPTSSGWPPGPGGLGRQGSSIYHGQAPIPQQQQMQPTQPQPPPPMTPTSMSATTGNRPPGMIQQPPRTQPGQINTGTSPKNNILVTRNDILYCNYITLL